MLRIREDKLTSRLDRDVAVDARARFLASVASELHKTNVAMNVVAEKRKDLELSAVYLHRASMLRYDEYGKILYYIRYAFTKSRTVKSIYGVKGLDILISILSICTVLYNSYYYIIILIITIIIRNVCLLHSGSFNGRGHIA